MNTYVQKTSENECKSIEKKSSKLDSVNQDVSTLRFVDNRSKTFLQKKMQNAINNSLRVRQLKSVQSNINHNNGKLNLQSIGNRNLIQGIFDLQIDFVQNAIQILGSSVITLINSCRKKGMHNSEIASHLKEKMEDNKSTAVDSSRSSESEPKSKKDAPSLFVDPEIRSLPSSSVPYSGSGSSSSSSSAPYSGSGSSSSSSSVPYSGSGSSSSSSSVPYSGSGSSSSSSSVLNKNNASIQKNIGRFRDWKRRTSYSPKVSREDLEIIKLIHQVEQNDTYSENDYQKISAHIMRSSEEQKESSGSDVLPPSGYEAVTQSTKTVFIRGMSVLTTTHRTVAISHIVDKNFHRSQNVRGIGPNDQYIHTSKSDSSSLYHITVDGSSTSGIPKYTIVKQGAVSSGMHHF